MRTPDYHEPLTCSGLSLDQEKLDDACTDALEHLFHRLRYCFGSVQIRAARDEGLESNLMVSLHVFAQRIADVISSAYVTETLARSREATGNMLEALAAGAHIVHKAARTGEDTRGHALAFAAIAACEGRPKILERHNAEHEPLAEEVEPR